MNVSFIYSPCIFFREYFGNFAMRDIAPVTCFGKQLFSENMKLLLGNRNVMSCGIALLHIVIMIYYVVYAIIMSDLETSYYSNIHRHQKMKGSVEYYKLFY